jgi:MFS transporter, PPP family, 3-phenylpropionic acid transporter
LPRAALSPSVPERSPIFLRLGAAWGAWGLSGGIFTPFFGAWLAWKGMSPTGIAALLSAGMLLRSIVPPITGLIADATGDRRGMMIALLALSFAGYLALNWAMTPLAIFVFAVTANVTGSAAGPLMDAVSTRLAERFGFDYGHVKRWNSITFAATNFVSGVAISRWGLVVLAPWLAASLALNVAAVAMLPPTPRDRTRGQFGITLAATLAEARELISSRTFALFLLAASLDQGSHAFYYGYGGLHWTQLGYSGVLIGTLWPLGVIGEAMLFSVSLRLFRALGAVRLLFFGALGCAVRWTVLAFDPPLAVVVAAQFLHAAIYALAHLGAMYFILKAVPPRLSATAQSLYSVMSNGVMMGAATYASGALYAAYGGRTYLLMSAMGVGAMGFAALLGRAWHGGGITRSGEA